MDLYVGECLINFFGDMKSKTKAVICSISFLLMMSALPIMRVLDSYALKVLILILDFISALSFVFFLIYWMFPNKRERAISRAKARKYFEDNGGAGLGGGFPPTFY